MATTTVAPMPARVAAVLATVSTWTAARRKSDGKPFYYIPSCNSDAVYMTATDGCTCPAAQNSRTGDCKHQEAVRQHSITLRNRAAYQSYKRVYGLCRVDGCMEDQLVNHDFCATHQLIDAF